MINLIDVTFKDQKTANYNHNFVSLADLIDLIKNSPIKGVNFWNTNDFPFYLSKLHENPWEIIDTIENNLKNVPITIDIKGNQLNNKESFSDDVIELLFQQFSDKTNYCFKIYDPLNDVEKISHVLEIANKLKLNIIGGIFLRPDLPNYPECHTEIINFYKEQKITHLSLIEPLGLLKKGQIEKIKKLIDESSQINLSFKHLKFEQSLLLNEALNCGISEFDYSLMTTEFGYPSLEAIIHSELFSEKTTNENKELYNLYINFKSKIVSNIPNDRTRNELEKHFFEHPQIPIEVLESVQNLQYFTNIGFSLQTIIDTVKRIQLEMGNPPLIEPFQSIIISQAIFRLQNSSKGIRTLATIKYVAGYYGKFPKSLENEFENYVSSSIQLAAKNKAFSLSNEKNRNLSEAISYYNIKSQDEKINLLFLISSKESNFYFNHYLPNPKSIDYTNKKNLASLVKTIFDTNSTKTHELGLPESVQQSQENQNEFRWRYLSRMFQMGKF